MDRREEAEKMAEVWRLNDERNKLIEANNQAAEARKKFTRGIHPRVAALKPE